MALADLRDAVRTNPIESSCGILLILGGGSLTLFPDAGAYTRFVGYGVSTVGTLLISWALTRAHVLRQQSSDLSRTLRAITRPLSTVASQLSQELYRSILPGGEPPDSRLLETSVQHLLGVLSELQVLIGAPITVEDVVAVKERLDMLGEELAAASHESFQSNDNTSDGDVKNRLLKFADEIRSLKLQLESTLPRRDRAYAQETVECPTCKVPVGVVLGSLQGDSALPACAACGTRFHVHRGPGGVISTRTWGGEGAVSLRVACPKCASTVPITVVREPAGARVRYCLSCFAKLQIDPTSRTAIVVRDPVPPTDGELLGQGPNTTISCPKCSRVRKTIFLKDGVYYAVCADDDILLKAVRLKPAVSREE